MGLNENAVYDLANYSSVERQMVRQVLTESGIAFQLTNVNLTVRKSNEFQVDAVLSGIELLSEVKKDEVTSSSENLEPSCEICGSRPAAQIILRRHVGFLIVGTTHTADHVLCDDCGSKATKEFQVETAKKGWTGVHSALINPIVITTNARNRQTHRNKLKGR